MIEALRWVNVVLAGLVVVLLLMESMHSWNTMTKRLQRAVPWVIATYVVIAYGSGEAARQDTPPGIRVVLTVLVLLGLVIALAFGLTDDGDRR